LIAGKYWLALYAVVVVANAGQPAAPAPPQTTSADEPDEEFIEFLGADDHGEDAAWRELLKNAPPGKQKPAAPPPDPKQ
jgi:hypothetical protein